MGTCTHTFTDTLQFWGPGSLSGNDNFNNSQFSTSTGFTDTWNDLIQVGADGPYQLTTSSTAACSCIGETFYNSGNDAQTAYPLPAITSLTLSTYAPFQPYVDTPQSANQYLVIWGNDLTADGESNPPYISVNGVGSSGGTISVTGFHLGSGWFVTETDSSGSSQINIPFWVDATATPGTYTLALATAGGSTSANFTVGDASPVITSISQNGIINSSFVVGNQVTMVISGQHFGTAQPNVAFPFGATWQSETYSDSVIQFNGFTATAAGSGYMNVMAEGYGNGFAPQNPNVSQSASAAASASSPAISIQQGPINVSSGDTSDKVGVSENPGTINFSPILTSALSYNLYSQCASTLAFPSTPTGSGTVYAPVTASGETSSCSGVFNVTAVVTGAKSPATTQVVVPPQVLIQLLYGEAHAQGVAGDNVSELSVGEAVANRFAQSSLFGGVTTWQGAITSAQFNGINKGIANGTTPELQNAAGVFAGTSGVSVAYCACFFTPDSAGWQAILTALNTNATVTPAVNFDPQCYVPNKQFVVKTSIGNNVNLPGVPAFIFEQSRSSATQPAVVRIP
jgi:hypothetical protein